MNWLQQIPIGQYVVGNTSWLLQLDPRLKLVWVLMFLVTPILAGPIWRLSLVIALLLITLASGLPKRIWWRSLSLLLLLALAIGCLSLTLPIGEPTASLNLRPLDELTGSIDVDDGMSWELLRLGPLRIYSFSLGPLSINRRSAELALKSATLTVTLVHSVNLMLLTTPAETLVWVLSWLLTPLTLLGLPVDRLSFQFLVALRFLPLVQEELQNLLRSLASRAVSPRNLGMKGSFSLLLTIGERFLTNILLRAEQGAEALLARSGNLLPRVDLRPDILRHGWRSWLNWVAAIALLVILGLRSKYGEL
ncbi:cobalt ABC transporter permease [cyanobiont of Ornithocercus magnificus]|nr:cobalt ABC transporter permease [cyanobiont of Ornithocercus magnificus]